MIEIGSVQKLHIQRFATLGAYLTDEEAEVEVLLPKRYLPDDAHNDMSFDVFIYRDTKGRMVGSPDMPKALVGQAARLTVKGTGSGGVFLDWGIDAELMVPNLEQLTPMSVGKDYLVGLYVDDQDMIRATMNVYSFLETAPEYKVGDWVDGTVFNVHNEHGAFIALEDRYLARLPLKEIYEPVQIGTTYRFRVTRKHEDGKVELSLREVAHVQRDVDSEAIMNALDQNKGFLKLHDGSDPEDIKRQLAMSKKAFKRALGKLYKEGVIEMLESGIQKKL